MQQQQQQKQHPYKLTDAAPPRLTLLLTAAATHQTFTNSRALARSCELFLRPTLALALHPVKKIPHCSH